MRQFILSLALAILASGAAFATPPPSGSPEQEVLAAHQARVEAFNRHDGTAWSRYVADDFSWVENDGSMSTRAELAARWSALGNTPYQPTLGDETERVIRVHGDVAVMTYRQKWDTHIAGVHSSAYSRATEVFQRREGRWIEISRQETDIPWSAVSPIDARPARYGDYVGRYRVGGDIVITVTSTDGKLYEQWPAEAKAEILPLDESVFFARGYPGTYEFLRDSRGKVVAQRYRDYTGDVLAKRLE
jgi:ketosteroid isomerase-like protein